MPLSLVIATAIAKKKKAKCIKTAKTLKIIAHKKSVVKSKLVACKIAKHRKNTASPIEKVMKIRAKAKFVKNTANILEKGATSFKNGNKRKAAGYFLEAALAGMAKCASEKKD
jgi:hypothetical protein